MRRRCSTNWRVTELKPPKGYRLDRVENDPLVVELPEMRLGNQTSSVPYQHDRWISTHLMMKSLQQNETYSRVGV